MKSLAAILLLVVALVHYGYDLIAIGYENATQAAKAWFYILRGAEGAVLFAVIAALAHQRWGRRSWVVALPCIWGMAEEAQTSICRLGKPTTESPRNELFSGLCGSEWYWLGLAAVAVIGGLILDFREKP